MSLESRARRLAAGELRLPIGAQLLGPANSEPRLLSLAAALD